MTKFFLAISLFFLSLTATATCPDLSGTFTCVDDTGQPPWTYVGTQFVNSDGYTVYDGLIADGLTRYVSESGHDYSYKAYCESNALIVESEGTLVDNDGITEYQMSSVNYGTNDRGEQISYIYSYNELVQTITCVPQQKFSAATLRSIYPLNRKTASLRYR